MRRWLISLVLWGLSGCIEPLPVSAPDTSPLALGESRVVELYALRLDVRDYEQTLTKADILALPKSLQDELWLLDLDLTGGSGSPLLMDNALHAIAQLDLDDASLSQAEKNMVRILQMTPDTASLEGTPLAELLNLAPKVGISPAQVLADSMGVGVESAFMRPWALTEALVEGLVATHPNAQTRPGPVSEDYPDGRIPVSAGHIPITLGDCADNMRPIATRFGPVAGDPSESRPFHPGFVADLSGAEVLTDDFKMTIRASGNAMPYKGLDLSHAEVGNVSSIGKDTDHLFDFSDPDWLQLEGLVERPKIGTFTFQILEHPTYVKAGTSALPAPRGNGEVWSTPTWCAERLLAEASFKAFKDWHFSDTYNLGSNPTPLFTIDIHDGWYTLETIGDIGTPPRPMYLWDLMLEVGQLRLHDGPDPSAPLEGAVPEGEANLRFTLHDLDLGLTTEAIRDAIQRNLERDPTRLVDAAATILDQTWGTPDIFYFRPRADAAPSEAGDWLYFIHADDLPEDTTRVMEDYAQPGFYRDEALTERLSDTREVSGDTTHEKVQIRPGDTLYVEDDTGARYRVEVGDKPSSHRIQLTLTRVL